MQTLASPLIHASGNFAERTALVCGQERFVYRDFVQRCRKLAGGLYALGLEPGDRVAVLSANCHRNVEAWAGLPAAGLVVVPLNTRHAEPELLYALEDSGAKVLLCDRDPGQLASVVDHVIAMPDAYEALVAGGREAPLGEGIDENSLAGLFYTGGTTGASKGVMLSHRNLIANAFHWLALVSQQPEDRFLVMAPLFHAAGSVQVLPTIWTGGSQVMLPVFDPAGTLELIEAEQITMSLGVPSMLAAVAEEQHARPRKVDSLRLFGHGGSPIATAVVRRFHEALPTAEMLEVYGATELSPLATGLRAEETWVDDKRGVSCGQAFPGVDVRVYQKPEAPGGPAVECAVGTVGEVVVRGPTVMQGYWNKPEQTAEVLVGGAYWTGDLGYLDEDGFLFLVDRSKDMIVSGGENVYSTEVEEALYKHPAVLEAAAFGVPDERWGEAVRAVVVPREGEPEPTPEELIAFCREHIGGYKVPKAIDLRHEPLPKSGPGKVLKRELRAPFWEGRERQVG